MLYVIIAVIVFLLICFGASLIPKLLKLVVTLGITYYLFLLAIGIVLWILFFW